MAHQELKNYLEDVLDNIPSQLLNVNFTGVKLYPGIQLTPSATAKAPNISWGGQAPAVYTLLVVDPDAPSREDSKQRDWNHWLVCNIQGSDIETGETLFPYVGPNPLKNSGHHRYVFILFNQKHPINFQEVPPELHGREKFDTRAFIKKYDLGIPVAANILVCEHERHAGK